LCEEAPKVLSQPAIDPELLKDLLSTGLHIEEARCVARCAKFTFHERVCQVAGLKMC